MAPVRLALRLDVFLVLLEAHLVKIPESVLKPTQIDSAEAAPLSVNPSKVAKTLDA